MLERLNEEIKRRTHVVRIFPNGDSCLRLVRALAVETHENWLEQHRYLNMDDLREHKKEALRRAARPPTRSGWQPARSVQDAARRLRRCRRLRGGILDCRCARRSARRQVGTKGWSFPIEQRDNAIDLKTHQHPLYMINLLNLTHTTQP